MSRLVKVEVGRFDYEFVGEFKFFKPDANGQVRRPTILVRLTDDEGYQGWGQAVPTPTWTYETPETVESTIINYLADVLIGMDPGDISEIHDRMNHTIYPACSIGQPLAKAAIDIACYDLIGKRKRQSIASMLGKHDLTSLQLSWTINSTDMSVIETQLEEGWQRGYRNFNFKVGPPQSESYDIELARKIRAFSPEGFLWADANTGYTLDQALKMIPELADEGVDVIESPLPPYLIRGYQALKKQSAIPVYMDEGIILDKVVEEFIALNMLDGITMKAARTSGIWQSQKIIDLAKKHGIPLLGSGLSDPDISLAASLHLFAWAGIDKPCALNGPQFLGNTLIKKGIEQQNDIIQVPQGHGLGMDMLPIAETYLTIAREI